MKAPIFIYGTLCSPQVVQVLLGRRLIAHHPLPSATLWGHARYPVTNYVFPGTIPTPVQPNNSVDGYLLEGLSPLECKLLDWFEGDEYDRILVDVERKGGTSEDDSPSMVVPAQVYIWKKELLGELEMNRQWSYEHFEKHHLDEYLKITVRPCRLEMEDLGMTQEE